MNSTNIWPCYGKLGGMINWRISRVGVNSTQLNSINLYYSNCQTAVKVTIYRVGQIKWHHFPFLLV